MNSIVTENKKKVRDLSVHVVHSVIPIHILRPHTHHRNICKGCCVLYVTSVADCGSLECMLCFPFKIAAFIWRQLNLREAL